MWKVVIDFNLCYTDLARVCYQVYAEMVVDEMASKIRNQGRKDHEPIVAISKNCIAEVK